jgi:hypothetical protein
MDNGGKSREFGREMELQSAILFDILCPLFLQTHLSSWDVLYLGGRG